jgi:isoaspartyl peptidase/L-asparaginase-like protein (Ntn-hydrolase superfamily)
MKRAVHIHGGASSDPDHKDGTVKAARIAIECLRDGKISLGAVLKAIEMIEKDPRFNTWTGSFIREGGKTV